MYKGIVGYDLENNEWIVLLKAHWTRQAAPKSSKSTHLAIAKDSKILLNKL